jgi:DNA-binding transcriptional LysR family regulator
MFALNADDLLLLGAVLRHRSQGAAAKALGLNQATVSRRLAQLEAQLGAPLFHRDGRHLRPSEKALLLAEPIERIEAAVADALARSRIADPRDQIVRVTAVPALIQFVLAPRLGQLLERRPGLVVEFVASADNLSLTRREADVALRLARPTTGALKTRRIGKLVHHEASAAAGTHGSRWVCYDAAFAHVPEAAWLDARAQEHGVAARFTDVGSMRAAIAAGIGRGLLPTIAAGPDIRLEPMPVLTREVWLVVHAELARSPAVNAVLDWIEQALRDADPPQLTG